MDSLKSLPKIKGTQDHVGWVRDGLNDQLVTCMIWLAFETAELNTETLTEEIKKWRDEENRSYKKQQKAWATQKSMYTISFIDITVSYYNRRKYHAYFITAKDKRSEYKQCRGFTFVEY